MTTEPVKRPKVKHISKMDDETFLKHMNARHVGAAGISHYGRSNVPNDTNERLLRSMHELLHSQTHLYDTDHDHGLPEPEEAP